jgi:hypothetical protein
MKKILALLSLALLAFTSVAAADVPSIKQVSAELEMKDFHETVFAPGPLAPGKSVTLTFKNDAVVRVTEVAPQENTIRLTAQLLRPNGGELYNSSFVTRYNSEAEIYEKKPDGNLVYRLKINPQVEEKK